MAIPIDTIYEQIKGDSNQEDFVEWVTWLNRELLRKTDIFLTETTCSELTEWIENDYKLVVHVGEYSNLGPGKPL